VSPPVADPLNAIVQRNGSAAIFLQGSASSGNPLTYTVLSAPTNGTLTGTAPNLTYRPNTNFVGNDHFTFKVNDTLTDSTPATVKISVLTPAGLVINPIWDSTILNDPQAGLITNTISGAILLLESYFADPVTVNINFSEMSSGLGQSSTYISTLAYSSVLSQLQAGAQTTNDTFAVSLLPGGPNNPVNGTSNLRVTLAEGRALGFNLQPPGGQPDSFISLNTSLCNLTRPDLDATKYDLMSVVTHEMDEVLGTSSAIGGSDPSVADLFRYASNGTRTWTTSGDNAYFSLDGTNLLVQYNQNSSGDYGDFWSTGAHTSRVQDAFGTPGASPDPGVELTLLDVIGWNFVYATVNAPLAFQSVSRSGTNIFLGWNSISGRSYQVQYKTDLSSGWNNLGNPVVAAGISTGTQDSIMQGSRRFYRVIMLTQPGLASGFSQSAIGTGLQLNVHSQHPALPGCVITAPVFKCEKICEPVVREIPVSE
jgi:hypothetical protein